MLIEPRPTDRPIDLTGLFQTEIPDVVTKGELAVNVRRSLHAGDLILVSGTLRISQWTDRETGHERSYLELAPPTSRHRCDSDRRTSGAQKHPVDRSINAARIPPRATGPGVGR